MFVVIMAGGQGTRLWPLSRKNAPKQLQALTSNKTLIRETYERCVPMVDSVRSIFISTSQAYEKQIKQILPEIPSENYIIEPFPMNNAAACILATAILAKKRHNPVVFFAYSDPAIKNEKRFREIIVAGAQVLTDHPNHIITVGIEPIKAETGYGYVQFGKEVTKDGSQIRVFKVKRFVEKPDQKTAEKYVKSFDYLVNSGMFMWRTDYFLRLSKQLMPGSCEAIANIAESWDTPDRNKILKQEYAKVEKISIDYGIMEKTSDILVIPGDFGWSDVGSWGTLYELLSEIQEKNNISRGHHVSHNDQSTLVFAGDKLIATIGLKDVVVVDTPDALLICNRHKSQEIKDLLKKLEDQKKDNYL